MWNSFGASNTGLNGTNIANATQLQLWNHPPLVLDPLSSHHNHHVATTMLSSNTTGNSYHHHHHAHDHHHHHQLNFNHTSGSLNADHTSTLHLHQQTFHPNQTYHNVQSLTNHLDRASLSSEVVNDASYMSSDSSTINISDIPVSGPPQVSKLISGGQLSQQHNPHSSLPSSQFDSRSNSRSQAGTPTPINPGDPSTSSANQINPIVHQSNGVGFHHSNSIDIGTLPGSSGALSTGSSAAGFACSSCNKVLPTKNSYQVHLNQHARSFEPGERPFPCDICAKAFSEKERLKIHMRTHTGEKPFSCNICGKSFSQKSTVKRHQTVHTGEKKFRCDCGKGFANRGNLIAHIKTRGPSHSE
ncbi:Zinc finger protein 182 [Fragariocoptes setiger]|uniref:Zinc finger protein 182 n=1 Tax=Fragariocoptes setiger TaxID=1670756 RepID=A0ABQ7SAJ7_9ACAR|nr:Zinc finger protein 182 [Fragariocoptes setiger]